MNRRDAILAGVTGIAAAVAVPPVTSAQVPAAENPELEPIRGLLEAYDKAFTNHDLDGVMACLSEKAALMGSGPGEIWSGTEEIKGAHEHFFDGFDKGEQNFEYEFNIGGVTSEIGWMMTSGNVSGKKDGNEFSFPINVSLTVAKETGKWLILAMHFSILAAQNEQ
jgi:ketosteroid isomerase-like protein